MRLNIVQNENQVKGYLDCPLPPSLRALMLGKMSLMIFPKLAALRGRCCRLSQYLLEDDKDRGDGQRSSKLQLHKAECVSFLTCRSRRRPVWAGRCPNAPPGDCGSSYRCEAGRRCWMSLSHHRYTHRTHISRKQSGSRVKLLEWITPEGLTSCLRSWVQTAAAGTGTACHCLRNAELLAVKAEQTTHEH